MGLLSSSYNTMEYTQYQLVTLEKELFTHRTVLFKVSDNSY